MLEENYCNYDIFARKKKIMKSYIYRRLSKKALERVHKNPGLTRGGATIEIISLPAKGTDACSVSVCVWGGAGVFCFVLFFSEVKKGGKSGWEEEGGRELVIFAAVALEWRSLARSRAAGKCITPLGTLGVLLDSIMQKYDNFSGPGLWRAL